MILFLFLQQQQKHEGGGLYFYYVMLIATFLNPPPPTLGSDVAPHLVGVFIYVWCRTMHIGVGPAPW